MSKVLTTGSPWRVILLFSVPLLLGSIVQQLYQFADAIVVGRHLGVTSLAAVGATGSLLFLLLGFAWGMTSGFAIPTAQAFGAGDEAAVRRSVAAGTILSAITSLILTIAAPLLAGPVLQLLRTPAELLPEATTFAQVSFLGASAMMFFNFYSAIIRAIGDSRTPLIFLTITCVLNVVFVILMVAVFEWGVGGAALATVVAQVISVALCLDFIRRRVPALKVQRADWKAARADLALHLRLGLPMGFQASIIAIGTLTVQIALNDLGADAVAAYTTAARVDSLAVAVLQSLGLATSMFVAQNLGGGRPDRIRRGVVQSLWMAIGASLVVAAIIIPAGGPLMQLFIGTGSPLVVDLGVQMLIINSVTYWILGILFILRGALQGLGQMGVPTITGVIELVARVGAALVLGGLIGYVGVVLANPLAWLGAVVLLVPAYIKAHRKLAQQPVQPTSGVLTDTMPIAVIGPGDGEMVTQALLPQATTGTIPIASASRSWWPWSKRK